MPVRFVLNTHWHGDHTGGNEGMGKDSTIVAHDNVRKRLAEGNPNLLGNKVDPAPKGALPIITFDNSLTVHLNGEDIRALHYAHGHTDGDSVIYFSKSNVVHMGDDFVTYGLPFVDVSSGGERGRPRGERREGHGRPARRREGDPRARCVSTKADVKKFTDMLRDCVSLVDAARKKGMTAEQMKAAKVLAKYEELGKGFVKTDGFVDLINNELSAKK
jgi:glyoxylase-like metal-dependent hydrolase (beta-lactamase superfamily II)